MKSRECRVEILLAEDSRVDVQVLQRCLRAVPFPYHLTVVSDGEAALAFLQRHAPYTVAPTPGLILLDVHLSKKSGWDVLRWVRAQAALSHIPVVMLTGAFAPFYQEQRDKLRPTLCLPKPPTVEEYRALVQVCQELVSQHPLSPALVGPL